MKEPKRECAKPVPPPKPNLKNKDFVKWSRAEACKKEDNIVSTEWHEKLQKTKPFVPAYNNVPLNMVYLLSGEYGRIWQKERDEWYSSVFILGKKDQDMDDRKKKIRKEIRAAKRAAEANIKERKERKAKEAELKAKAEAEKAEKLRARILKCESKKKKEEKKKKQDKKKRQEAQSSLSSEEPTEDICPKNWRPVELTIQCECSSHQREDTSEKKEAQEKETPPQEPECEVSKSPPVCDGYYKQLKDVQNAKTQEFRDSVETQQNIENEIKEELKTCPRS